MALLRLTRFNLTAFNAGIFDSVLWRLRVYWVCPVLAAAARIDIAMSVLIIGLLLRKNRPAPGRIA